MVLRNPSCVLVQPEKLEIQDKGIKEPSDNEVQVEIKSNGICGSDTHKWKTGKLGTYELKEPLVLGHESSGVVVKLGANVRDLKIGDRVALEAGMGCGTCATCKSGRYNICPDFRCPSLPGRDGTLARYINYPQDYCFKIPDAVSFEEGALIEPLAVAVHACRRARVSFGQKILIGGSGTIGLATLLTAKSMGAVKIVLTDVNAKRLEFAEKLGGIGINVQGKTTQELKKEIEEKLGCSPHTTIECSGAEDSINLGIAVTRNGGSIVLVGFTPNETMKTSTMTMICKELDIIGSFAYVNAYPESIEMVAKGLVPIRELITHRYKFDDVMEAFEKAHNDVDNAIKVMVNNY